MLKLFKELDRILRGQATTLPELREGTIRIRAGGICLLILLLGAVYGLCMGSFSLINRDAIEIERIFATMVKVPALFFLTVIVTFPSLYVFNALVGSRLDLSAVLRLIIASLAVTLAVLASFGPIAAFFSFTTGSYPFMLLLHVVIFAVSGVLGLAFLLQTLHRLSVATHEWPTETLPAAPPRTNAETDAVQPGTAETDVAQADADETHDDHKPPVAAIDRLRGHVLGANVKGVFRIWIIVFGLVGAQMAWVLRPFLGNPDLPFTWLRERDSNFFEAVWNTLLKLLSLILVS